MKNAGKRLGIDSEVNVRGNANSNKDRRREKFFEQWSKIRAEGAVKFGLKVTTNFSVSMFIIMAVMEFLKDGIPEAKRLFVRVGTIVIFGVILSAMTWWANEGKYKNIKIDKRIRAREAQWS
jgi:hypothetical protein